MRVVLLVYARVDVCDYVYVGVCVRVLCYIGIVQSGITWISDGPWQSLSASKRRTG